MKNKLTIKLLTVILISIIFCTLIISPSIYAASITEGELRQDGVEQTEEDVKIMMYDATTGVTTEVNMEEMRKDVALNSRMMRNGVRTLDYYAPSELINENAKYTYEKVEDTSVFPYKSIGLIEVDGGHATGALVGANIALTAAHCVVAEIENGSLFHTNWTIKPGYDEATGQTKVEESGWTRVYYPNKWCVRDENGNIERHENGKPVVDNDYDWCICVLEKPLGNYYGYNGLQVYESPAQGILSQLYNMKVQMIGYPGTPYNGVDQYKYFGNITKVNDIRITADIGSVGGSSGSPYLNEDLYIVAVLSGGEDGFSTGPRMTNDIADIVETLRRRIFR